MTDALKAAIKELLAVPCKIETENKKTHKAAIAEWQKVLAKTTVSPQDRKDIETKLAKALASGPDDCEGQWCAARAKVAAAFNAKE